MDYGFIHEGRVFTPNATDGVTPEDNDARNAMLQAAELADWQTKPDAFCGYVGNDRTVTTWLGTTLGRVVALSSYRNNLGARIDCVTVRGSNGATYHGRYGSDWARLVRLRRSK